MKIKKIVVKYSFGKLETIIYEYDVLSETKTNYIYSLGKDRPTKRLSKEDISKINIEEEMSIKKPSITAKTLVLADMNEDEIIKKLVDEIKLSVVIIEEIAKTFRPILDKEIENSKEIIDVNNI